MNITTMLESFVTWEILATYGGAVAATMLIVQFTKGWWAKLPTQVYAYIIALIILLAATGFTGGLTAASAALCPLNAAVVAAAASGLYTGAQRIAAAAAGK